MAGSGRVISFFPSQDGAPDPDDFLAPGEFFSLGGPGPGVAIRFRYGVTPIDGSHSVVRLGDTLTGIASPLFARIFGRRIAGHLPVAATQLARLAEKRSTAPS